MSERHHSSRDDPRYMALRKGIEQLNRNQLTVLVGSVESGNPMIVDGCNYDPVSRTWCPLAVALEVERILRDEGITASTDEEAKEHIVRIGTRTNPGLGAALLRRPFSPLFMGVVARRGCLFGSFCGGQASGQASIGSLSRRQPDGIRLRCGTAPPNTPVWTFPRRSGSVSWEGRFCDGCGGIRLSGCSRSVVCGGWRRLRRGRGLPVIARRPANERKRLGTGAAPTGSGVDGQAPAGTPRATRQPGGGRRSGRENRRSRCHRALATARA